MATTRRAQVSWVELQVPAAAGGGPLTINLAEGITVAELRSLLLTGQSVLLANVGDLVAVSEVFSVSNPLLRPTAVEAVTVSGVATVSTGGSVAFILDFLVASTTLSGLSGASATAAGLIPAGSYVWGVRIEVLTTVTGVTGIDVGDSNHPALWAGNVGKDQGTKTDLADMLITALPLYIDASNVVLRAVDGTFTGGSVKISVYYSKLPAA